VDERNPYAPSRASLAGSAVEPRLDGGGATLWREGNVLVALPDASMPHRCVKCNEPAVEPTKGRKVYWHHPLLYLLLLLNVLIYAVVAMVVRKKATVAPGLCAEHKKRRGRAITLGWIGFLSGIVLVYVGEASALGFWGAMLGVLVMLGSIAAGMIFARIVYAKRIDESYVRLKGCGAPFLNSLPPFPS
jgi:hypothetical protein